MSTVNLTKQTINLSKGDKVNLSKTSEKLKQVTVGLGWDPAKKGIISKLFGTSTHNIDCDAWVAVFKEDRLIETVCYSNLNNVNRSIIHMGDNLTGEGEGDDEQIKIDFAKLPSEVTELLIGVTIYRGSDRNQSFDMIKNTFIRIVDDSDNFEICKYLQKEFSKGKKDKTFLAGRFIKKANEWEFEALGESNGYDIIRQAVDNYKQTYK